MTEFPKRLFFIFLTVLSACSGAGDSSTATRIPDAQELKTPDIRIRFDRFERDWFALNKQNFSADTAMLFKKYGSFPELFSSRIIRTGSRTQPLFRENILGFLNDPDIRTVYAEVQKQYPDIAFLEKPLSEGLNRYHRVFPDTLIPRVVTMVSGFNYSVAATDSVLAIGLDMYLGSKSQFYEWLAMPSYKVKNMHRDMIVADALRGFVTASHSFNQKQEDLISHMVYHGKIQYFCTQLLPNEAAERFLGYDKAQLDWCKANEGRIWSLFIDKKLFYSNDFNDQVSFINDGPFTPGFPKDSPPKIGVWLGWQIVSSYMEKNPKMSIAELLANTDAHQIFKSSGYKPAKL